MSNKFLVATVDDTDAFKRNVYGGEDILKFYPDLLTVGVDLFPDRNLFYITSDGVIDNDTAFFTKEELAFMELEVSYRGTLKLREAIARRDG